MKNQLFLILLILIIVSCKNKNQEDQLNWLNNWLEAWELVSLNILNLPEGKPPLMLFYDKEFVYTTAPISAPNGVEFEGPIYFAKKLPWLKQAHNDTLILPNGQKAPIQLMTFAAPSEKEDAEAFFVMAAPSFWENIGLEDEDVGLDKMLTGIFLHEFTHTRQMDGIGKKIMAFEKDNKFDFTVNDDIIQHYFSSDSLYVRHFKKEVELFYSAANEESLPELKNKTKQALFLLEERQKKYLQPKKEVLVEMDHTFLSMEGIGQYVMVTWLSHPNGGNFKKEVAIKSARRNKKWWSQDEGLGLILVYEKLADNPDWSQLFNENPQNIVQMIENELE